MDASGRLARRIKGNNHETTWNDGPHRGDVPGVRSLENTDPGHNRPHR